MNKAELIEALATDTGLSKTDAEKVLNSTIDSIKKAVKRSEKVTLVGFGTFLKAKRKARSARNPQTGQAIKVAACTVPKFRAGREFRDFLN